MLQVSSKTKKGFDKFWEFVLEFRKNTSNEFLEKRGRQRIVWMWTHLEEGLKTFLLQDPRLKSITDSLQNQVRSGQVTPGTASDTILTSVRSLIKSPKE